jgi:hypothetical protein
VKVATQVMPGRWTAQIDGDFVVFLIGARFNSTYLVRDGEYEAIYGNMPAHGLAKATTLLPLSEASGARQRLRTAANA